MFLEVIAQNIDDIKVINKSKADQIEYCINLDVGGLTPKIKDIKEAIIASNKRMRIMLRIHHDSFLIKKYQIKKLVNIIRETRDLNFDGYVFGAITKDKKINFKVLEIIMKNIGDKSLTFHKAFDFVENKIEELEKLLKYKKIKYVLTSGGVGCPLDNLDFFKSVQKNLRTSILVGGNVDKKVITVLSKMGFNNFHIGRKARVKNSFNNSISKKIIEKIKV